MRFFQLWSQFSQKVHPYGSIDIFPNLHSLKNQIPLLYFKFRFRNTKGEHFLQILFLKYYICIILESPPLFQIFVTSSNKKEKK